MKKTVRLIGCLGIIVLPLLFAPGCGSTPAKTAFNVEVGSQAGVIPAWQTFRTLRAQRKIDDSTWIKATNAVTAYHNAADGLLNVAATLRGTTNQTALITAIDAFTAAQTNINAILIQYVPGFIPK